MSNGSVSLSRSGVRRLVSNQLLTCLLVLRWCAGGLQFLCHSEKCVTMVWIAKLQIWLSIATSQSCIIPGV
jgi:hypothetical protein